jgi:asparagine synthase (glutamine-hydrolysing)
MCGICGIFDFRGSIDLKDSVQKMADVLLHRGPDDGDIRIYRPTSANGPRLALGHRRLSIIDLSSAGRQPMPGRTEDTAVVFNGEIYNFLKKRAECSDYPYRSHSDTELILALYDRYGEQFVEHLDGMFAFALWDGMKGRLMLARDRAGKKPLFYYRGAGFLAFASEIKSLLVLKEIAPALNPSALPLYLTYGYVPTPDTFYEGVQKLRPGTLLTVAADASMKSRIFWQYPLRSETEWDNSGAGDLALKEEQLRTHLRQAVASRMIADVPLGAFLSGGIDSSIIVGLMSQLSSEPVRTFNIGFEDDITYDETAYARLIATRFRTHHTEFRVRPKAIDLLEKLIWHYDEPFGDSSAIPTYMVSELARQHVTVALSGDGGDELFAGYERFAAALWADKLPRSLFTAGQFLAHFIPAPGHAKSRLRRIKRFFEKATLPLLERYLEWNSFFTEAEVRALLLTPPGISLADSFKECLAESAHCSLLKQILYLNFKTYLLDDLLVKTDRMSMAHSLEVRCPFLDTTLIEWAAALPDAYKIRGTCLKYILKRAFCDLLPKEILNRGKMGFGVPLGYWMRHELRDFSHDMLLGPSARIRHLLDASATERFLVEHQRQLQDHGQKIWALLCLELWLRKMNSNETKTRSKPMGFDPLPRRETAD